MSDKELLDFYLQIYYAELTRKDTVNQTIALPVAVLTLLFGGIMLFLKNMPDPPFRGIAVVFLLMGTAAVCCMIAALYFYVRAWWKHAYAYLPLPEKLEQHRKVLEDYCTRVNSSETPQSAFLKYLIEITVQCATYNRSANIRKVRYAFLGTGFMVAAIALMVASMLPFYMLGGFDRPEEIQIVQPQPQEESDATREPAKGAGESLAPRVGPEGPRSGRDRRR